MTVRYFIAMCMALLAVPSYVSAQGSSVQATLAANGQALLAHPGETYQLEWSSRNAASCSMSYQGSSQRDSYPVAANTSSSGRSGLVGWYTLRCTAKNGQSVSRTTVIAHTPGPWPAAPPAAATVEEQMAPFIVAGGAGTVRWLQGDALGELLYGGDAHIYLHRMDQAATGDPTGRTRVGCADIPRQHLAVVLIAGQSNAANSASADADGRYYSTTKPVYNLNIGDGKCYVAENPILGSDARLDASQRPIDQSFALPLAAALIEGGLFTHVLLVPISVSGTLIEQWTPSPPRTPGASLFRRFVVAIEHLKNAGLAPTFLLWHQGEGNSGPIVNAKMHRALTPDIRQAATLSWMRNFLHMVAALRDMGVAAPVFVAKATVCGGWGPSAEIRRAQASVVDPAWKIFSGPDTDAIGQALRRDGCHFSHEGNLAHAQKWFEVLRDFVGRPAQERPAIPALPPPTK
jgi:hypothetical protein